MRILLVALSLVTFTSFSQEVKNYTIKTKENEAERKMILDLARKEVEEDIKQKVVFKVQHLKVSENYAWFQADAVGVNGEELSMPEDYYDCCHVEGLFEKKNGTWQKVEFVGFSTDCWYCGIAVKYPKAPKEIFSDAAIGQE